ncbi:MAG: hypothetical protein E7256_00895 [Lachnospiraceae bacterium]|nr:hypothetical protein [Lachnospiraceae bacterium]
MRSLSNVIKAYSIKYDESEKKMIDTNEKADLFQKVYFETFSKSEEEGAAEESAASSDNAGEFVEGLSFVKIEETEEAAQLPEPEDTSSLMMKEEILSQARAEADRIMEEARMQAQEIIQEANASIAALKETEFQRAKEEGFASGWNEGSGQCELIKKQLKEESLQLQKEYEDRIKQIEPKVGSLLIQFVEKLTGHILEEKRDVIEYRIGQALSEIENSHTYIIRVSKEDFPAASAKKQELLAMLKEGADIEIIEDCLLSVGQCLIETDSRVFDCGLDTALSSLASDLRLLSGLQTRNNA